MKFLYVAFVCFLFGVAQAQDYCTMCQYVIGAAENWLEANYTVSEVETMVEDITCNFLPSTYEGMCDVLIDDGIAMAAQYIAQNEDPRTVCTDLEFCTSSKKSAKNVKVVVPAPVPKPTPPKDDDLCTTCQAVMTIIEKYVAQNSTEQFITIYLEQVVCNSLFTNPSLNQTCDAIFEAGVPTIIEWIENEESPLVICQQLDLCAATIRGLLKASKIRKIVPLKLA